MSCGSSSERKTTTPVVWGGKFKKVKNVCLTKKELLQQFMMIIGRGFGFVDFFGFNDPK